MTPARTADASHVPQSLRPGLREATHALRIANHPTTHSVPPGEETGDEIDHEAAATAELGHLLDTLSETVDALARASSSSRRAQLRGLEATLTEAGVHAARLSSTPADHEPRSR